MIKLPYAFNVEELPTSQYAIDLILVWTDDRSIDKIYETKN